MEGYIAICFFCSVIRLTNRAILQNNLVVSGWVLVKYREIYRAYLIYISLFV